MGEADRWRVVSAVLATACIFLGLMLWTANARLHVAQQRVLHALDGCPLSHEDLEHS